MAAVKDCVVFSSEIDLVSSFDSGFDGNSLVKSEIYIKTKQVIRTNLVDQHTVRSLKAYMLFYLYISLFILFKGLFIIGNFIFKYVFLFVRLLPFPHKIDAVLKLKFIDSDARNCLCYCSVGKYMTVI